MVEAWLAVAYRMKGGGSRLEPILPPMVDTGPFEPTWRLMVAIRPFAPTLPPMVDTGPFEPTWRLKVAIGPFAPTLPPTVDIGQFEPTWPLIVASRPYGACPALVRFEKAPV